MSMSVSFKKASNKTNLKHNNREFTEKQKEKNSHIDYDRTEQNKTLVKEDLKKLYEREFGQALEKYNDKQKRKDRKIDSYYEHIKDSKKTFVQQEMIIQVGDKDDFNSPEDFKKANEILEEWFEDFEERNPNLKVYNAVIHNDEASPHLHLNFVPVAGDYKRGLEKQVSFDRAIKQQDDTLNKRRPFKDWRDKEVNLVADLLQERGIERKLVGTNEYKDVNEYKEKKDLEREIKTLEKDLSQKKNELINLTNEKPKKINTKAIKAKNEMKDVKVKSGEKFLGLDIKETKTKETGNIILPEKSFRRLVKDAEQNEQLKGQVEKYLETDLVQENKKLEGKLDRAITLNQGNIETHNELKRDYSKALVENDELKEKVKSLKKEIGVIYSNVKTMLKDYTADKDMFKRIFKSLTNEIKERVRGSEFERIDDEENKKERKQERENKRSHGPRR